MAVGWISPEHPVAEAMTAIGAALDGVAESPVWSLPDGQVEELLGGAHRLEGRMAELTTRLVEEADRRELAKRAGASSTQAWLRHRWQVSPADAKRQVTLAASLAGGLELTRRALAAGDITRAHAGVIVKVMDSLSAGLGDATLAAAERQLVDWCRQFDPVEVARLGRRLWEVVDPDGADAREAALLQRQERDAKRQRQLSFGADGVGLHLLRGRFDTEAAAVIAAALDPLAKPLPSTADGPDPRSPGQRYADALVEVCRRQLDTGDLPSRGGEKPQVMVTIGLDQLKTLTGSGSLDTGEQLSPEAVRKLACDAQVLPAVLGGDSRLLDFGRASRTFTPAQRRALGLRDGDGCAFPGCDRPMAWCDGHHIRHWIDGGPTDLANGVLLCGYHHTTIHQGDWIVQLAADGRPSFHPPSWIDTNRRARRNHIHRRSLASDGRSG
jgi:uncharacterized protein DUF222/HNH endonuclease